MSENHKEETEIELNDELDYQAQLLKANEEIDKLKEEILEFRDKLLRSAAEIENIRKRGEKQIEEASKYSVTSFAKALLNVFDNLYRTSDSIGKEKNFDKNIIKIVAEGIDLTKKEFEKTFEKFDIKRINPELGSDFDHNFHQAVVHIDSEQYKSGTIANVLQAGYVLHDRLLRPAMVAVAK